MALEADSVNGGLLVEGMKGGCTGIMLPQENATEPLGKHAPSSTHHTHTTANSDITALRGICLNSRDSRGKVHVLVHIDKAGVL